MRNECKVQYATYSKSRIGIIPGDCREELCRKYVYDVISHADEKLGSHRHDNATNEKSCNNKTLKRHARVSLNNRVTLVFLS